VVIKRGLWIPRKENPRDFTPRWLKETTLVVEDAVQEVGVVAKEVKPETLHPICLEILGKIRFAIISQRRTNV
jgi:hypothetical protein